jgi:sugar-specific transcriptional regulator TrmB
MDRDTLREALEEGGLTAYQTDAYLTLLHRGMASATEVASYSSVPTSKIYDVLRTLEDRGYIETFEQDTLHARPVDPQDVLEDLRGGNLLVEAADEIEKRWQRPAMSDHHMTVFKSDDTVLGRAEEQIREAETGV